MSRNQLRFAAAIFVATVAALFRYAEYLRTNASSDLGVILFGARSLLHGINPYPLVGPGLPFNWEFHLNYPATAMIVVLPLGVLPESLASLVFVWVSAAILTCALTKRGWERIWILPSAAFIVAARSAQWSPIYCAAYLLPGLAWMLSAKPTLGAAVLAGARSMRTIRFAVIGTIALVAVSPGNVSAMAQGVDSHRSRKRILTCDYVARRGALVLLALVRWRLPEARLVAAMACIPSTASWYEALPLLLVGQTKRECQVLSLLSSAGYALAGLLLAHDEFVEVRYVRSLMLAFCYLPALWTVLRRPNTLT